jgi:hypothetical protein
MGPLGEPFLNGYTTTYDSATGEWVARSNSSGTVLRGKDQAGLDEARWDLIMSLADELAAIIRAAPARGYSPPPRHMRTVASP